MFVNKVVDMDVWIGMLQGNMIQTHIFIIALLSRVSALDFGLQYISVLLEM